MVTGRCVAFLRVSALHACFMQAGLLCNSRCTLKVGVRKVWTVQGRLLPPSVLFASYLVLQAKIVVFLGLRVLHAGSRLCCELQ